MGAINLLMSDPVASAVTARDQMRELISHAADTIMPAVL
jgi:hypothetical protein